MARRESRASAVDGGIAKAPTGIHGLDEITNGGLPQGRPTLVCGSAGCGKTLLAMEFLVRGALDYGEPGVFVAFEETAKELTENVRSLGFDLDKLIRQKKLFIDYVQFDRNDIQETGEYNLDGLFIRLADAIDTIGAKRIVLDTLETLFSGFENEAILRAELRRLFRWLKERGVTAVITAERGDGALTRQGLEEYVSDCVILLDHRVYDQLATRRLRVVKYRGTTHGTNEYPFLIESTGIEVIPITSVGLTHTASNERVSTGLAELDAMLGGRGLYRGSTVLVSGTAGTGKTSLGCQLAVAHCSRGERVLYFAFEESSSQIARNMRSIGLNLQRWMMNDLLRFHAVRPTTYGLEAHLAVMYKQIRDFKPRLVIIDPITNFISIAGAPEVKSMLMRLIDFMKQEAITSIFSSLTLGSSAMEATDVAVSSIVDTWLVVRDIELNGERNRALHILKSRGMHHSNQVREYRLTSRGIVLSEVYLGPEGSLLTGSARVAQEARETAAAIARRGEIRRKQRALERKRAALEAQIASMRSEFETESDELSLEISAGETREQQVARDREAMAESRSAVGSKVLQQPGLRRRSRHEELK